MNAHTKIKAESVTVKDTFLELDDALGQMYDALQVIEVLTANTTANLATSPAHQQWQRMRGLVNTAWDAAMNGAAA